MFFTYPLAKELGEQSLLLRVCIFNNTHETSCALPDWNKLCPALMYPCCVSFTGVCEEDEQKVGRNDICKGEIGLGLGGQDKMKINGEEEMN